MRSILVRRTAVAATAVCLAVLATACSGSADKGGDSGDKAKPSAAAPEAADVKVPSAAELEKMALAEGDVKQHQVRKAGPAESIAAGEARADKTECLPVARAMGAVPQGEPAGTATARRVTETGEKNKEAVESGDIMAAFRLTTTQVALGAYAGKGAEEALAALRKAATDCAGGFTATLKGQPAKVTGITEAKVSGGDEAGTWNLLVDGDGGKVTYKITAVRKGAVLASFASLNLGAAGGKDYPLPTAVIDAQAAKLG
ncbi:hypothetical protein [Streptomyces sp. NRRL S-118]|uniref:hypothetical protein n=1 Tax=Streptomyces sp. NRRL S-118 TaxID=1463881 RepID=UPI0004CBAE2E|nr:hypothetical protein [Streptomyces sp. NRRL S-118]